MKPKYASCEGLHVASYKLKAEYKKQAFRGHSHERATFSDGKKFFSDFKLLTLELFRLHHQSLKLKFLKYAAQVTTDFEPIFAQKLCPNINVTFVMMVQKYLINRYFFPKYKNPIYFFLSQQLIRKPDLFNQFFEQEIVRKLFTIIVKIAYLVLH